MTLAFSTLVENSGSLTERLSALHDHLLQSVPGVDSIACALYDADRDRLKTFLNSTRVGKAIAGYEYRLADSLSLSHLAESGQFRVLDEIAVLMGSDSSHATWLKEQGYRSSFTVPIYDQGKLLGFIFFDSMQPGAFLPEVQRDLVLYTTLITMSITNEISAVRMVIESARVARELTEMRDFETGMHLERMGRYSRIIARSVAPQRGFDDEFVESVYLFAPLHDIGKISIPDRILLKPGKLDATERAIMETHVHKGMEIIERIIGRNGLNHFPDSKTLKNIVLCHHEYLDGSGYPQGLSGEQVPLEARIVAVADIFDALTAQRPYKEKWALETAFVELERLAGLGKLDADCVAALRSHAQEVFEIQHRYVDPDADEDTGVAALG
jgi:HD-GYP domain-containing protein (c-di-GMP phosphodiesterase class II)